MDPDLRVGWAVSAQFDLPLPEGRVEREVGAVLDDARRVDQPVGARVRVPAIVGRRAVAAEIDVDPAVAAEAVVLDQITRRVRAGHRDGRAGDADDVVLLNIDAADAVFEHDAATGRGFGRGAEGDAGHGGAADAVAAHFGAASAVLAGDQALSRIRRGDQHGVAHADDVVAPARLAADHHLGSAAGFDAHGRVRPARDGVGQDAHLGRVLVAHDDAGRSGQHAVEADEDGVRAGHDRDGALAVGQRFGGGERLVRRRISGQRQVARDQADPVAGDARVLGQLLDRDADPVARDHVGRGRADRDVARGAADEDADVVARLAAAGADADPVGVDRGLRAGVADFDAGRQRGGDDVVAHHRERAVHDEHAVVVCEAGAARAEADHVAGDQRADAARAADHDAVPRSLPAVVVGGVAGEVVGADGAVAADAHIGRAGQHGDAGQAVGRGAAAVAGHAGPVALQRRARRAGADDRDALALEVAEGEAAHDRAAGVDGDPARVARVAAVEVDRRRLAGLPAGLRRAVDLDALVVERGEGAGRLDCRVAGQIEDDAVGALGCVGGVDGGAEGAARAGAAAFLVRGGDDGPAVRGLAAGGVGDQQEHGEGRGGERCAGGGAEHGLSG